MTQMDELANLLEEYGVGIVKGWAGASPCKPDRDIVLAASYFAVAASLRSRQEKQDG